MQIKWVVITAQSVLKLPRCYNHFEMIEKKNHKKLAIFDIDGTLYRWQLYYEVVFQLLENNFFDESQTQKIKKVFHGWQSREVDFHVFESIAIPALESKLSSLTVPVFESIVDDILNDSQHKIYSYTRNLASELKEKGYFLLAISGSMQEIVEPFSKRYGFDDCIGWLYEKNDHKFTGRTLRQTVGRKAKILQDYIQLHGMSLTGSIGIGDSTSDIEMLELVDDPIAFNPNEQLLAAAEENGWKIVIERKNIAYTLQKDNDGSIVLAQADRL